jgi:hypothetical protein
VIWNQRVEYIPGHCVDRLNRVCGRRSGLCAVDRKRMSGRELFWSWMIACRESVSIAYRSRIGHLEMCEGFHNIVI